MPQPTVGAGDRAINKVSPCLPGTYTILGHLECKSINK